MISEMEEIGSDFIARHVKIRHASVLENSAGWFSLFPQTENVGYFGDILKGSLCLFAENTLKKKKIALTPQPVFSLLMFSTPPTHLPSNRLGLQMSLNDS